MKVAAAVPRVRVADCDFNASEIIRCVNEAVSMEVQVIVFPELCITGYSCGDLFFQETLLHGAVQSLRQIADATLLQDIIVIVGMPLAVESLLLNTAVVLQRGRMLGVVSKSYLPNYREFQEKRWFVSACCCDVKETILHQQLVPLGNDLVFCTPAGNFGIELCEDLWAPIPPSSCLAMNGADVIFNLSASDECSGKHDYLCSLLTDQSLRTCSGYVYSSSGFGESMASSMKTGNLSARPDVFHSTDKSLLPTSTLPPYAVSDKRMKFLSLVPVTIHSSGSDVLLHPRSCTGWNKKWFRHADIFSWGV